MRQVFKLFGLLLVLILAQQGAVVHQLSHVSCTGNTGLKAGSAAADTACALCPAFAQVDTPAFSHSFHIPLLVRTALTSSSESLLAVFDTAVPTARSRGPPA